MLLKIEVDTHLFLGTQEAFKSLAKGSRWRILKQDYYNPREKDSISNIENLTDVVRLAWESLKSPSRKPWTTLLCITWVSRLSQFVPTSISCHLARMFLFISVY